MRKLARLLPLAAALALAAALPGVAQVPAQSPETPPASEIEPVPAAPPPAATAPALSNSARIKLCRKKKDQPLEPQESPPVRVGGDVTRPTNIQRVEPDFSRAGARGTLTLEAIIDEDGCVREAKILEGLDAQQDAAALKAVREWVFRPALFNGQPVRVYYGLTMNFR